MKVVANILADKDLRKRILADEYYSADRFVEDALCYIKAIKEGRMINSIGSVSGSGMSRTMKFLSCENYGERYNYRNYYLFMKVLGHSFRGESHYFTVKGCGMDMVFATNYNLIHRLKNLGIISEDECSLLAQQTPTTI